MNLKEIRKKIGKTQKEVATDLFVNLDTYKSYELGRRQADISTLIKIADYYDVSLDYLCGRQYKNDVGLLTDIQKANVFLLKQLSEKNNIFINGYMLRMLKEQQANA